MTREQERRKSAEWLLSLSKDFLYDLFGITRVGDITGLDTIGVPVWSAKRPLSHSVSVAAGKNLDPSLAKAGAIAEAIEVHLFEHPDCEPKLIVRTRRDLEKGGFPLSWTAKGEVFEIEEEPVMHYITGANIPMPSDLVWLDVRPKSIFQRTSNGQALGASISDAILGGLYECVERDAMTIRKKNNEVTGVLPPLVSLYGANERVSEIVSRIEKSGLRAFVFRITLDIPIPIMQALILDPAQSSAPFYGFGTSVFESVAIERALLEAVQGRTVYIAGDRDDVSRSEFRKMMERSQKETIDYLDTIPDSNADWGVQEIGDEEELGIAFNALGPWGANMFVKILSIPYPVYASKVIIPGLEQPITPDWKPVRWVKP